METAFTSLRIARGRMAATKLAGNQGSSADAAYTKSRTPAATADFSKSVMTDIIENLNLFPERCEFKTCVLVCHM